MVGGFVITAQSRFLVRTQNMSGKLLLATSLRQAQSTKFTMQTRRGRLLEHKVLTIFAWARFLLYLLDE